MAGTTEIYLCKAGQALKQGRVAYSDSIDNRAQAETDAIQRCKWDKKLAKIAYYAVSDEGDFRLILTYNNPNMENSEEKGEAIGEKYTVAKKKPVKKPGLMARMVNAVAGTGSTKKSKKSTGKKKKAQSG